MRVAILKPAFGGIGGFERLVSRIRLGLVTGGAEVNVVEVDASTRPWTMHGLPLGDGIRDWHDEYFMYLATLERMDRIDLTGFDAVLATQPPTYLARHRAVVALTYHQARVFYDLADDFAASGFVDPDVHAEACHQVQAIDRSRLDGTRTWVTGSQEVADRLQRTWGITGTTPFRARSEVAVAGPEALESFDPSGPAVCVSRHEWPKRTELVVAAAAVSDGPAWELVGGGSRLSWVRHLAEHGTGGGTDSETWRNTGPRLLETAASDVAPWRDHRVVIHGEVDDSTRDSAYGRAGVVVAPAYREDYGLTVLEAFARARPVVVCRDGGGLVELVGDSGAGLVVDASPAAIAHAVAELRADPDRSRAMAEAAWATAKAAAAVDDLKPLLAAVERSAG